MQLCGHVGEDQRLAPEAKRGWLDHMHELDTVTRGVRRRGPAIGLIARARAEWTRVTYWSALGLERRATGYMRGMTRLTGWRKAPGTCSQ